MQNFVIMNLAIWNGCWIVGHHILWWQNTYFFSVKLIYIFFTARGKMEFSYRIRSALTLVITHKSIFLLHRYLVRNVPINMYGAKWFYYTPLHYVLYRHYIVPQAAYRSYDRMFWALLLATTYCGSSIWPGIVLLWSHKYCGLALTTNCDRHDLPQSKFFQQKKNTISVPTLILIYMS